MALAANRSRAYRVREKGIADAMQLDRDDMQRITKALDAEFRKHMRRQFQSEGAHGGDAWAPLSARYAERKRRLLSGALSQMRSENRQISRLRGGRGPRTPSLASSMKILQLTGSLRDSLATDNREHVAEWYLKPKPTVRLGSSNEIGAYHADTRVHNPQLPVRDPRSMTTSQRRDMYDIVGAELKKKIKRLERAFRALRNRQ